MTWFFNIHKIHKVWLDLIRFTQLFWNWFEKKYLFFLSRSNNLVCYAWQVNQLICSALLIESFIQPPVCVVSPVYDAVFVQVFHRREDLTSVAAHLPLLQPLPLTDPVHQVSSCTELHGHVVTVLRLQGLRHTDKHTHSYSCTVHMNRTSLFLTSLCNAVTVFGLYMHFWWFVCEHWCIWICEFILDFSTSRRTTMWGCRTIWWIRGSLFMFFSTYESCRAFFLSITLMAT